MVNEILNDRDMEIFRQVHCLFHTVAEREEAKGLRKRAQDVWSLTFDAIDDTVQDENMRIVRANKKVHQFFQARDGDLNGRYCHEIFSGNSELCSGCPIRTALGNGEGTSAVIEFEKPGKSLQLTASIIPSSVGSERYLVHVARDITHQREMKRALRESEERFSKAFGSNPAPMVISDISTGLFIDVNRKWLEMLGYSREELIGHTSRDMGIWENPEERDRMVAEFSAKGSIKEFPVTYRTKSGEIRSVQRSAEKITLGGREVMLSLIYDFTERQRAEADRIVLESQLHQAQKMESVGRLTGGVAHDFNNILGVIIGYSELALLKVDSSHELRDDLVKILDAARRSADIVRQLLAFSRQQPISPVTLDLNTTVEDMTKILRRLIGEDIELVWIAQPDLNSIKMDPTQMTQILANLCINARDAITGTGRITIETAMVTLDEKYCTDHAGFHYGDFVQLTVSDNGCGIGNENQEKIFEPFFTTKEMGNGTGLGLSTVYGIVKQNHGFINVYSEPGKGSTFKLYFPPCTEKGLRLERAAGKEAGRGNGETILLVEDDSVLLAMACKMLKQLDYHVLTADTPGGACSLAEEYPGNIHLLMTDVIMPEMNGKELANLLQSRFHDLKCLFTSGYTANVIEQSGVLDKDIHFIQKPYSLGGLAEKILGALNENKKGAKGAEKHLSP